MRDMWIIIESLRNSLDQLIRAVPRWLARCLVFDDFVGGAPALADTWRVLGLNDKWCEEFARLHLRYESGALRAAKDAELDNTPPEKVMACFQHLFDFRQWSDTRWCAVGRVCRRLSACVVCGLPALIDFVRKSPGESMYYLDGFQRWNCEIARMVMVCALSARASEAPLSVVLDDDRLASRLPQLDKVIRLERERVDAISTSVFEFLGTFCDLPAVGLAAQTVRAVLVQVGYGEMRLRTLRGLPWCLVGPDIESKLLALQNEPMPTEEVGMKIHTLLNLGVLAAALAPAVKMLGELPFTTRIVEQGHALSSQMMKWHKDYTTKTMTARTTVCVLGQLVSPQEDLAAQEVRRCHNFLLGEA